MLDKIMASILLVFLFLLTACATSSTKDPLKNPQLYELSKEGKSHFILGTIHIALDAEKMYPEIFPLIDMSTVYISELDLKTYATKTSGQYDEGELYYKSKKDGTLETDLSPAAFKMTEDALFYISDATFHTLKPYRAYQLLKEKYVKEEPQTTEDEKIAIRKKIAPTLIIRKDEKSFDEQLEEYAIAHGKKNIGLEDFKDPIVEKCEQLIAIASIEEMAFKEKANPTDDFFNQARVKLDTCLGKERNEAWMIKLTSILAKEDRAFIAVGMAHLLAGESTVLDLMKSEGYTIKRVQGKE